MEVYIVWIWPTCQITDQSTIRSTSGSSAATRWRHLRSNIRTSGSSSRTRHVIRWCRSIWTVKTYVTSDRTLTNNSLDPCSLLTYTVWRCTMVYYTGQMVDVSTSRNTTQTLTSTYTMKCSQTVNTLLDWTSGIPHHSRNQVSNRLQLQYIVIYLLWGSWLQVNWHLCKHSTTCI